MFHLGMLYLRCLLDTPVDLSDREGAGIQETGLSH